MSDSSPFQIQVVAASSLNELVAAMNPGSMSDFSVNNWNWDLIETGTVSSLAWSTKGYWDPFDRKAYHFGAGHRPTRGVHVRYDDASNSFEDFTPPGIPPIQGPKHSYEHIAFQPRSGQRGVLYHRQYNDVVVERLDLETEVWDTIASIPASVWQVASGLEWFPELHSGAGGLVFTDSRGVKTWNPQTDTWTSRGNPWPIDNYHTFATYLPDHQVVLFGGGNQVGSDGLDVFQIDADGAISVRNNAPHPIGVNEKGIFLAAAGYKPTLFAFDNRVYEYDYDVDRWTDVASHDLYRVGSATDWVTGISIEGYGCALFMIEKNPPLVKVYKFRSA